MISIEAEDKLKGDIWLGKFTAEQIQQITVKAKNPKKYQIFIKMLLSSLLGQTQSVLFQILTYAELQRKMNLSSGRKDNKKYIIMTYMSEFDKAHYPLSLNYLQKPTIQRMRITIRRLAQEIQLLNSQQIGNSIQGTQGREAVMLKYENETLKARIKNLQNKLHGYENNRDGENMDKSNVNNELKNQNNQINQKQIQTLKTTLFQKDKQIDSLRNQIKQLNQTNNKKQNFIKELKQEISQYKEDRKNRREDEQTFKLLEEKINQMNRQTEELVAELQHTKEMEKKGQLKIVNLEKELEKMMTLKQQKTRTGPLRGHINNHLNSSRRSDSEKSEKSFTSQKSNQSNRSNNSKTKGLASYLSKPISSTRKNNSNNNTYNNNKKVIVSKKSSVYDSDTESSKLRKANNSKVSPFRQTNKPSMHSNSNKTKPNINSSNLNRFQGNILNNSRDSRNRSRSKSRSVKKQNSPPVEIPTDNFASSSEDERNVNQTLTKLRENRVKIMSGERKQNKQKSVMGPLERKITDIAQRLRKAKSRQLDRD